LDQAWESEDTQPKSGESVKASLTTDVSPCAFCEAGPVTGRRETKSERVGDLPIQYEDLEAIKAPRRDHAFCEYKALEAVRSIGSLYGEQRCEKKQNPHSRGMISI